MHPHKFITRRSIVAFSLAALLFLTVGFIFAPMKSLAAARHAIGARLNASPTAQKIFSIAPAPVRAIARRQFAPVTITANATSAPIATLSAGEANIGTSLEAASPMVLDAFTNVVSTAQPVCAGASVTWVLTADNNGAADTNITITFNAPVGWNVSSVVPAGFTGGTGCSSAGTSITCNFASLAPNTNGTVTVTSTIPAAAPAALDVAPQNAGSYTSDQVATIGAAGTGVVDVQNCFGGAGNTIGITKTRTISNTVGGVLSGGVNNAIAGLSTVTYTITVTNNGPSDAQIGDLNVVDVLTPPTGITPTISAIGGTFSPGCATLFTTGCTNAVAIPGSGSVGARSRTITFSFLVPENAHLTAAECTTFTNTATVSAPNDTNNPSQQATATPVNVVQRGLFDINNFTAAPNPVYSGQSFTYSFIFERENNIGGDLNESVFYGGTLTFNLPIDPQIPAGQPPIVEIVSSTIPAGWTCTPAPLVDLTVATSVITCTPPAAGIPPGSANYPFSFTVRTNSLLPNGAALTNPGPNAIAWTPPAPGTCDAGPVSDSPTEGPITVNVIANADLGINKTATPASVTAGDVADIITYTLTVGNNPQVEPGSDAVNVVVLDNVPANVNVVSQPVFTQLTPPVQFPMAVINVTCTAATAGAQFSCTPTGNTGIDPTYVDGVWPKGLTGTIVWTANVPANVPAGTIISNAASMNSNTAGQVQNTPDPNSGNNVSLPTSTNVDASSNQGIVKTVGAGPFVAGGAPFTYTLTVNNAGPSNAANSVVTDSLPAGILYVSHTANNGFTCTVPAVDTTGQIVCTNPSFPAGGSAVITITVRIAPNVGPGPISNTATISSSSEATGEGSDSDNSSTLPITVVNDANLTITKTGPTEICAGNNLTYVITVNNSGFSSASNVQVTDTINPAQAEFVSVTGTGAFSGACSYSSASNTLTCTAAQVPQGQHTINMTIKVLPSALTTPALINTANITATVGTLPTPASATNTTNILHCTDLELTKTASPDPVAPGQNLTYTITVKNLGPSVSSPGEFSIADTIPAGTTLVGTINAPGFTCNGLTSFPCSLDVGNTLAVGASKTITFVVQVSPNYIASNGTQITNTADVNIPGGGAANDPVSSNNTASATTQVIPLADLSVVKTANTFLGAFNGAGVIAGGTVSPSLVPPGSVATPGSLGTGEIEYTLTYRNNGPSDAVNVHIRDVIPANSLAVVLVGPPFVSTPAPGTPAFTCELIPFLTSYQVDCHTVGNVNLPNGANGTITFRVRVPENVAKGTVIKNQATINSEGSGSPPPPGGDELTVANRFAPQRISRLLQVGGTADPSAGNNTSLETQNVVDTLADLAITKAGPATIIAGQQITYTLTVTNNGPSDAQSVVVKDTLPTGVSFVSAVSNNPNVVCSHAGGVVTCNLTTMFAPVIGLPNPPIIPPRTGTNTFTVTIVGQVDPGLAPGQLLNTATVSSATNDTTPANNTSNTVTTTVTSEADVNITKSDSPDPVVAGTNLTYTITVNNVGPSNANSVVVTDPLPADTSFVSVSGTGPFSTAGACVHVGPAPGTLTCTASGPLAPNSPQTITLVVKVDSDYPNAGPIVNVATATWANNVGGGTGTETATASTAVIRVADLAIDKSTAASNIIAGTNVDFTIKVTNNGPSDVFGNIGEPGSPGSVVVTDTLPAGASYISATATGAGGFTCSAGPAPGTVTCLNAAGTAGNIPAGAFATIIIKVSSPSNLAAGTNFCNTATVAVNPALHPDPDPTDPNTGNNTDSACVVVTTSADLTVAKTSLPVEDPDNGAGPLAPVPTPTPPAPLGSVKAGGYLRYDVPFGNNGPSDAINVLLSNVVPANTAFVGALGTGGTFTPGAQPPAVPFTFTIAATDTLAPINPAPFNITCTVINQAGTQQIFCRPTGNTAVDPTYVDGVLPAGYGGTLTFFVRVNESAPGGSIVTDPAIITSGLCPNGAGPTPPPFPPVACASTPDPNSSNNTSQTTQNLVIASSSLTVTKVVQSAVTQASSPNQTGPIGPATAPNGTATTGMAVVPGTTLTYRVTVTNNGPSDVKNVRLTDVLPSGLETPPGRVLGVKYISVAPVVPSGVTFTCDAPTGINPTNNPQQNGGSLQCTAPLLSATAPNNSAAIDITVFIDPATRANLVNTATVDATINQVNLPVSGQATLTTPVAPRSDVALTKTHTNDVGQVGGSVTAGTLFTYTITVTNNGQSTANGVSVIDTLPPFQKVNVISIQQSPNGNGDPAFTCTAVPPVGTPGNTTSVTCTTAALPPNRNPDNTVNPAGTAVITLTVLQDPLTPQPTPTSYTNCVSSTLGAGEFDPNTANNTNICITVPIDFEADPTTGGSVTVQKTDTPDPVIAGNLLTYTITATNNGPSAAFNFRITDILPAQLRFVSAAASPGATLVMPAVGANGTVTATWDAAGETPGGLTGVNVTRTLTIVTRVCPDTPCSTISNTATASSLTFEGNALNNSDTEDTTVQAQSDLSITKTATPNPAKPNSNVTYTINFANAGPSNAAGVVITDLLPAGFTVVSTSSTIAGTTFSQAVGGDTCDQITLTINLGTLGAANQCAANPLPTSGTVTIVAKVPVDFPNVFVTNTATITSTNCAADPNLANNTASATIEISDQPMGGFAGLAFPANSEASDDKAGSILFYPLYTSNGAAPGSQNSRISLTNAGPTPARVHLFVVDGSSCSASDVFICLTPNQTATFRASDFDPGVTGYIVAVAVNAVTGQPIAHNYLIGDAYVKFSSGHFANYGAVAVSALKINPVCVDPTATQATLRFDGINYNRLPRILAADGIPSPSEGNSTMISVHAVGGNLSQGGATIGSLTGNLYDHLENNYSWNQAANVCQYRNILSDSFPRTFVPFSQAIQAGHTGWMKIRAFADVAILGVQINFNPNSGNFGNAFNEGHTLHHFTLTNTATLTIPVDIPECQ